MSPSEAERVIEALRFGIPPRGHVREFTVGRESQIRGLTRGLEKQSRQLPAERGTALLVRANWGAGKSHLLEVVREVAIEEGYAVALVVANAQGGVRFNRMETILGEACRQIEVPGSERHGLGALLDAYTSVDENRLPATTREMRASISSDGRWDLSNTLRSPAMYVALRAWTVARKGEERTRVETRVEDWFHNPVAYRAQRQLLYRDLVETLRSRFRDPRPDWRFYSDGVFVFNTMGHRQSWDALADLDLLARLSGQRGMVFLIDEFEDVIQNLQRRDYKEAAFLNLFHFFRGEVPSLSYFAVTPEFSAKCKHELLSRGVIDYDFGQFDKLASFELDPIDTEMIVGLAFKIRDVHAVAYGWNAKKAVPERELRDLSRRLGDSALPDRVRQSIVGVVRFLDDRYQA